MIIAENLGTHFLQEPMGFKKIVLIIFKRPGVFELFVICQKWGEYLPGLYHVLLYKNVKFPLEI